MELPDEYRSSVLQAVLAQGGAVEHRQLMDAYKKLEKSIDQKQVQQSVGWTPALATKSEMLRWAISGEVKIQDFFYLMMSVSNSSREGLDMMWKFFTSEFDAIYGMVKSASPSIMDAVIGASTAGFCSEEKATEIEAFFEKHPLPSNKRTISQKLEEIRTNAQFLTRALQTDLAQEQFWKDLHAIA